jgi:hypothetical protein
MKRFCLLIATLAMGMIAADLSAEPPQQRKPRNAGQRVPNLAQGRQRDPQQMVAEMIKKFDVDGDLKLDSNELTALLKSMRARAGQPMARRGDPAGPGQAAGASRRRAGINRGGENGKPGGQRPKRPGAAE